MSRATRALPTTCRASGPYLIDALHGDGLPRVASAGRGLGLECGEKEVVGISHQGAFEVRRDRNRAPTLGHHCHAGTLHRADDRIDVLDSQLKTRCAAILNPCAQW